MRRKLLLFMIVGVAAVLVPALAVLAQSSSTPSVRSSGSPATSIGNKNPTAYSTDDKIIDEMIEILKETKSEKTFVVTALALGSMGADAKRALPHLIRNAERLKLLEDLFAPADSKGDRDVSQQVAEAIVMLAAGQPMGYLSTTQSVPCANGNSAPAGVGGGPCQPDLVPQGDPSYTYTTPSTACPVPNGPVPPAVVTPGFVPPGPGVGGAPTPPVPTPNPWRTKTNTSRKESKPRTPVTPPQYAR